MKQLDYKKALKAAGTFLVVWQAVDFSLDYKKVLSAFIAAGFAGTNTKAKAKAE